MSEFLGDAAKAAKTGADQAMAAGNDLLKKLGAAYYAERRDSGAPDNTEQALSALDAHIATNGDAVLRD